MRRCAPLLALAVVAAALAGCASTSDELAATASTASISPSTSPESGAPTDDVSPAPESTSGNPAADAYCTAVDDFIAATKAALADPLHADTRKLQKQSDELKRQATALAAQLINDPEAITQVQQCTQELQDFTSQ